MQEFSLTDLQNVLNKKSPADAGNEENYMPAAVMVLIYLKNGEYSILLNKRSELVEHHKGEMSFPGGAKDPVDNDFLDTALRETEEEMGISKSDITVLGRLDDVITRSNFIVKVYVGTIEYPYQFNPSIEEIAEVVEIPISNLLSSDNHSIETRWDGKNFNDVITYAFQNYLVYGATAIILAQFLDIVSDNFVMKESLI
jgi:8-oxo-dGTP pyrophosphatase MutT (NUDIX family)